MSDKMPNYLVEIKRMEVELATMELNLKRNELKKMELEAELDRIVENDNSTRKNIQDITNKLLQMKETHLQDNEE